MKHIPLSTGGVALVSDQDYYQDKKAAAKAYNQAAREYFGEFAYQNPI
jgi:hypothetical protein